MEVFFDIDKKKNLINDLEKKIAEPNFWDNQNKATSIINNLNTLKDVVELFGVLTIKANNFDLELDFLKEEYDEEMHALLSEEYTKLSEEVQGFEMQILLNDEYDDYPALIEIHPGAGGVESQDWAAILYRMYTRYFEQKKFKIEILDYQQADEAGIKSVSLLVKGKNAYGYLKNEKGVHRLVRISPFDSNKRRHTSFASIDVLPEFKNNLDIEILEKDLKIDTFRASGAGGQHVNKTDSAVRLTHLPSGIVVSCQSERSQIQNKDRALNLLKAKLKQQKLEEALKQKASLRGEVKNIEWGSQVRSYIFMPYTLVKDHRSGYETGDINKVINGDLDDLIYFGLKGGKTNEN